MLPHNIRDREYYKFKETSQGQTSVRFSPEDSGSILEGVRYNKINVEYPANNQEIYRFLLDSSEVCSIAVTYTDASKKNLLSIERTDVI